METGALNNTCKSPADITFPSFYGDRPTSANVTLALAEGPLAKRSEAPPPREAHALPSETLSFPLINSSELKEKATQLLFTKNQIHIYTLAGRYYSATGLELPNIGVNPLLLEQYKQIQELEETIDASSGKIPPRHVYAFWVTLNPPTQDFEPEEVIDTLTNDVQRLRSTWVDYMEWTFENRADKPADIGKGIHLHALVYLRVPALQDKQKFSQFVSDYEKKVKKMFGYNTCIYRCDNKTYIPRQKYLRGQKNRSKSHRVKLDADFRLRYNLAPYYSTQKTLSKN